MPRTKEQNEQIRQATREKIQAAAMQLFVQKGYGSTNVQDIADSAGISIGLMYRHYKNKESLFQELVEFALAGLDRNIAYFESDLNNSDLTPSQLINQFVDEVYHDMQQGEALANLLIIMAQTFLSVGGDNALQREVAETSGRMRLATAKLIERGQERGEFRAGDANQMAMFFYAALQGLAEMKVMLKSEFTMPSPAILTAFLYSGKE